MYTLFKGDEPIAVNIRLFNAKEYHGGIAIYNNPIADGGWGIGDPDVVYAPGEWSFLVKDDEDE